jgi:hypothetical protein
VPGPDTLRLAASLWDEDRVTPAARRQLMQPLEGRLRGSGTAVFR